jgi:hypothetical protein
VTNHTHSQKAWLRQGVVPTALKVDLMPAETYLEEKSARGRVTSLTAFSRTRALPPIHLYVSESLRAAVDFFYAGLDLDRTFGPGPPGPARRFETVLKTQYFEFAQVVRTTVAEAGSDLVSRVRKIRSRYDGRAAVYQFWVDLSHPGAPEAVLVLQKAAFFLGGVVPLWNGGDALLLQKTLQTPDWGTMQVVGEKAQAMLDRVREDWGRAAAV